MIMKIWVMTKKEINFVINVKDRPKSKPIFIGKAYFKENVTPKLWLNLSNLKIKKNLSNLKI